MLSGRRVNSEICQRHSQTRAMLMTVSSNTAKRITVSLAIAIGLLIASLSNAADVKKTDDKKAAEPGASAQKAPAEPPYKAVESFKTIINPHKQISDEGEVMWNTCLICHKGVPDTDKVRSINDVTLRVGGEFKELCYRCHTVKLHPEAPGVASSMSGIAAPNHLIEPTKIIRQNLRVSMKDAAIVMPLDPKSGKITCVTCHNPHERGLLYGRANWGADSQIRLRSEGTDICQFCHRK